MSENKGQCIYESGRFRLRTESDYAIVDELEKYPPIMVSMNEKGDGEGQYMDRRGVLHLLNELSDTNPEEHKYQYITRILERVQAKNYELRKENKKLKAQLECGEDVCRICKHTYLVPSGKYYIAQCKKEHSGCSKGTVDYCDDFELKDSDSE